MAKKDLIGGGLWEQYSGKVTERMNAPQYMGELTEQDAERLGGELVVADWGAESCGDAVRLFWVVDPESGRILDARFKSFGCGTAIASSDVMAELCIGRTVDEAVKVTNIDVERALRDDAGTPAVPPQKMHCSVMAYDVIRKAASLYKGIDLSLLEEQDIVCECARVTLRTIKDVIRLNDLHTVEEITRFHQSRGLLQVVHPARRPRVPQVLPGGHPRRNPPEMEQEEIRARTEEADFARMSPVQKYRAVERALDRDIRQSLAARRRKRRGGRYPGRGGRRHRRIHPVRGSLRRMPLQLHRDARCDRPGADRKPGPGNPRASGVDAPLVGLDGLLPATEAGAYGRQREVVQTITGAELLLPRFGRPSRRGCRTPACRLTAPDARPYNGVPCGIRRSMI